MLYKIAIFIYCILWAIKIRVQSEFDNTIEKMYRTDYELDLLENLIYETF